MPSKKLGDYDVYLFDWDGNVARTLESWLSILSTTLKAYGLEATDQEISARFGKWDIALDFGLDPTLLDEFVGKVKVEAVAKIPTVPLYEHVREALNELKSRGKKLALITSNIKQVIDLALVHHGLEGQFDVIISGDMVTKHKPNPESLNLALEKLKVPTNKALFLGDSDKDLLAANNAGMDCLLFYPDAHKIFYDKAYLESLNPKFTISSWAQVKV